MRDICYACGHSFSYHRELELECFVGHWPVDFYPYPRRLEGLIICRCETKETLGAFNLGKKPGNFGGSKSGISDW